MHMYAGRRVCMGNMLRPMCNIVVSVEIVTTEYSTSTPAYYVKHFIIEDGFF